MWLFDLFRKKKRSNPIEVHEVPLQRMGPQGSSPFPLRDTSAPSSPLFHRIAPPGISHREEDNEDDGLDVVGTIVAAELLSEAFSSDSSDSSSDWGSSSDSDSSSDFGGFDGGGSGGGGASGDW